MGARDALRGFASKKAREKSSPKASAARFSDANVRLVLFGSRSRSIAGRLVPIRLDRAFFDILSAAILC